MLSWSRSPPAVASSALRIESAVSGGSSSIRPRSRTRAPCRTSSSVSLTMTLPRSWSRPSTSSSERPQFSRLKAYSDSTGTPRRTAWRMISRTPSTPAAWPCSSSRPFLRAQRRLPSMMMATWRGRSSAATENAGCRPRWTIDGASVGREIGRATRPPGSPAPSPRRPGPRRRHACRSRAGAAPAHDEIRPCQACLRALPS